MATSITRRLLCAAARPSVASRSSILASNLSVSRPPQRPLSASFSSSSRRPRLEGEVAIITGGSAGIGRETALLFAQEGAAGLCIVDVNEEQGHKTVEELKSQHGAKAIFVKADVSKANEVENVSHNTTAERSRLQRHQVGIHSAQLTCPRAIDPPDSVCSM
jgi:hypothetical protein